MTLAPRLFAYGLLALLLQRCCTPSEAAESRPAGVGSEGHRVPAVETSKPRTGQRTYLLDKPADRGNAYIRIKAVTVSGERTTVVVLIANSTGRVMHGVSTAAPGASAAFYLRSTDRKRQFVLRATYGIAVTPTKIDIPAGGSLQFTLVFDPIDPAMTAFDMNEGDEQQAGMNYWHFSDVRLQ